MATKFSRPHRMLLIAACILTLYMALWLGFDLRSFLSLPTILAHRAALMAYVTHHYIPAVCAYIGVYVLHSACSMPATSLLIITGGMLFDVYPAMSYAMCGSIMGGSCAYAIARAFGKRLNTYYDGMLRAFQERLARHYVACLLTLRLIPIMPFALTNAFCGLSLVPFNIFLLTLIVGIIPSLYLYSTIGETLGTAEHWEEVLNERFIGAACILGLLGCIALLIAALRARFTKDVS